MRVSPDTVEFGEATKIVVQAKDARGNVKFVADGENPIGLEPQKVDVGVTGEVKAGVGSVWVKPSIEKFCQSDPRWATVRYDEYVRKTRDGKRDSVDAQGNKVYHTVASKGCALTAIAMVARAGGANVDPGKLAEYMNENNGFQDTKVIWATVNDALGNSKYKVDQNGFIGKGLKYKNDKVTVDLTNSTPIDLTKMDTELSNGALVIAQVYNPTTGNQHWVVVTEKRGNAYRILDPGCYEGRNDLTAYSHNVYKIIIYRKK